MTKAPYNADTTGMTLSTNALQSAINDANAAGGGIVYVPAGVYLTGNIQMKSNVSLYLEGGSVLRCTGNPNDYTVHFKKSQLGQNRNGTWFIYAEEAENFKIFGRGTIDARGDYMLKNKNFTSNVLFFQQCEDVTLDGIVIRDSGFWGTFILRSNNIELLNTKHFQEVRNDYGENDAVDIVESQNVLVKHSIGISEDDSYSTKCYTSSTTPPDTPPWGLEELAYNWKGYGEAVDDVAFDDCVAWSSCGTYKVGFGAAQSQTNIIFRNSTSYKSMYGISIQFTAGSAPSKNITFENIGIEGFDPRPGNSSRWLDFRIRSNANCSVSNVMVKDIIVHEVGSSPSNLTGKDHVRSFNNITFSNIKMPGAFFPAESLDEMNITNAAYYYNLTILP